MHIDGKIKLNAYTVTLKGIDQKILYIITIIMPFSTFKLASYKESHITKFGVNGL